MSGNPKITEMPLDKAVDFINSFKSADDLAAFARSLGLRSVPGCPKNCIVADLLKMTGNRASVFVNMGLHDKRLAGHRHYVADGFQRFPLSAEVTRFIDRFDVRTYPELEQ